MHTHDVASFDAEQRQEAHDFLRGLKDRHVQLIALGGAIGVGLFLGSAEPSARPAPASSSPTPRRA